MSKTLRQSSFPRTPTGASFARRLIAEALRGWMSESDRTDFVLAVGEAVSNAVRHGDGDTFSIRCWSEDGNVSVEVMDAGPGFARSSIERSQSGGYGMLIIYKLTDEVHLLHGGSKVRLVKRLPAIPEIPYRAG